MPNPELGLWGTTSGLFEEGRITVKDAHWEIDEVFDRLLLKLHVETDDPDQPEADLQFAAGPTTTWITEDDGKSATTIKGNLKPFNQSSGVGMFLVYAAKLGDVIAPLIAKGNPHEAATWIDSVWDVETILHDYKGEIGEVNRLVPTAFHGYSNNGAKGVKTVAKAPAAKKAVAKKVAAPAKSSAPDATAWSEALGGTELYEEMKQAVQDSGGDISTFAEAALAILEQYEGLPDSAQESVLDDSPSGFFASHWLAS